MNKYHAKISFCFIGLMLAYTAPVRAEDVWTESYVGLLISSSRNTINGSTTKSDSTASANATNEAARINDDASGTGLYFGSRHRMDSGLLIGWEADVAQPGRGTSYTNMISSLQQPSAILRYKTPWIATARLTAGWSFGNLLLYATGGAAVAEQEMERTQFQLNVATNLTEPRFTETDKAATWGYAVGAGADWRFSKQLNIRVEYMATNFPSETFLFPDARGGAQGAFSTVQGRIARNTSDIGSARIGLSYTFGRSK